MAFNFRQYKNDVVYILVVVILLQGCCVVEVSGLIYSNDTQNTLCDAQCEAKCLDLAVSSFFFPPFISIFKRLKN